jgi:hypothetical protein
VTGYLRGDVAELRYWIAARRDQERDEPRHPSQPDGPWWFPDRDEARAIRDDER